MRLTSVTSELRCDAVKLVPLYSVNIKVYELVVDIEVFLLWNSKTWVTRGGDDTFSQHWVRPWTWQLFSVTEMWVPQFCCLKPYLAVETWKAHLLFTWLELLPISCLQCFGLELTEPARLYLLWPTLQTWSLVIYCFCIGALLFWLMNSNISVIFTWGAVVIFACLQLPQEVFCVYGWVVMTGNDHEVEQGGN